MVLKSTDVDNMSTSSNNLVVSGSQPSVQDAAWRSSTQTDSASFGCSEKGVIAVLLSLLEGLSYNVLSGDVWWLAEHSARHIAVEKYGVSEEAFNTLMPKLRAACASKGKQNPMSSVF